MFEEERPHLKPLPLPLPLLGMAMSGGIRVAIGAPPTPRRLQRLPDCLQPV
jgi:hypothetical protein